MKNFDTESKRWIEQAKYDLNTSLWNAKGKLYAPACFWAQQAAEKAAKAYLYSKGERLVFGHSVAELLEKCRTFDQGFKTLIQIGGFLDRFYIPTRYPNGLPGGIPAQAYREKDSKEAIKMAQKILGFVMGKL
ncbi:MAG: HEPN domain-containing protein [Deltaproteobacteria bacterium]|nr:HEPN domain-containing protein [Deltaproteobacteria bacterium]